METGDAASTGTILIAGCGYVGGRLARRMASAGPVLALVRRASSAEALNRQGLPAIAHDFERPGPMELPNRPAGLRAVVYLVPPSGSGTEDLRLARFLEALGSARPEASLYLSTTGVYGDAAGASVDEESPVFPGDDRARQRLDAERRAAAWCGERGTRPVVFRVPAIYGPHRLPLDRLWRGEPVLRAEDSGPGNRIHADDLVAACVAALERPVSGVFNLTDGDPESAAAFTARVAALAGLPTPRRVSWTEARSVMSPGLLGFLRESRRVCSRRAGELGWSPRYGHAAEGIRASLLEMGLAIAPGAGA